MFLTSYNTLGQGKSCKVTEECEPIKLASIKACPSSGKVVITAPPGIGYSVATGSDAQTVLKWWCLQWEQRNRAKIPGNQLG